MSVWIEGQRFTGMDSVPTQRVLRASSLTVVCGEGWEHRRWDVVRTGEGMVGDRPERRQVWYSVDVSGLLVPLASALGMETTHDYMAASLESFLRERIVAGLLARFPGMPYAVAVRHSFGMSYMRAGDGWHRLRQGELAGLDVLCQTGVARVVNDVPVTRVRVDGSVDMTDFGDWQ